MGSVGTEAYVEGMFAARERQDLRAALAVEVPAQQSEPRRATYGGNTPLDVRGHRSASKFETYCYRLGTRHALALLSHFFGINGCFSL